MIRLLACIAFLWVTAAAASAQTLRVTSGEHDAFTRVVVSIPSPTDWALNQERAGGDLMLRIPGGPFRVDLSRAFELIERDRVADILPAQDGTGLDIRLACFCVAERFVFRDRFLVIDIRESTEAVLDVPQSVTEPPADLSPFTTLRMGGVPSIGPRRELADLLPDVAIDTGSEVLSAPVASDRTPAALAASDPSGEIADALERELARTVAEAATGGILDVADRLDPSEWRSDTVEQAEEGNNPPGSNAPKIDAKTAEMQERETALRDAVVGLVTENGDGGVVRIAGERCLPNDLFDLEAWADERPMHLQIGAMRQTLFGEFDRIDQEAADRLVRAYLHFGFGAEARSILRLASETPDPVLNALGGIVDGALDRAGLLVPQTGCDGDVALWALLGSENLPDGAKIDTRAVLRAFEALPGHLKPHIGARLTARLIEEREVDAARSLLGRLNRSQGGETEETELERARLAQALGEFEKAKARFEDLAGRSDSVAPQAIVGALEITVETGETVPREIADLAGAFSREFRDTEAGPPLWLANQRALLASRQFDSAMSGLRSVEDVPTEIVDTARAEAFRLLTDEADDVAFLKHVLPLRRSESLTLPPATRLAVARRLLELGMADAALTQLDELEREIQEPGIRLLRARALLDLSRPEDAELVLVGLDGPDALELRAEARQRMGDFAFAQSVYRRLGREDRAEEAAWISGDWSEVAEGANPVFAEAARLVEQDTAPPLSGPPSLALATDLASQSNAMRETLSTLLRETRIDPESGMPRE